MLSTTIILGAGAAVASTVSFIPQAWRIIRTADTKSISIGMYIITVTGFALWTAYGVRLGQWPLVAANTDLLHSFWIHPSDEIAATPEKEKQLKSKIVGK